MGIKRQKQGEKMVMKWGCLFQEMKNQTCGHKKIPLTLLPILQLTSGLISKTGGSKVVFLNWLRKDLHYEKL